MFAEKEFESSTAKAPINDGQIRCQAVPSVHKTADGKLYRNDSVRDNDTSVQSQPPVVRGSRKEGGRQRSCRGWNSHDAVKPAAVQMIALKGQCQSHGLSRLGK